MPRVDFHSQVSDKYNYTCRLVRKARAANCQIIILVNDEDQLRLLDQELWQFSATDFLPHVGLSDALAAVTPILLTTQLSNSIPHRDLLINLRPQVPDHFEQFNRVIEIVSSDTEDAQAGRQRFKQYQQSGIQPSHTVASTT
jgi:DNA polymerase-3 subunit chi